MIRDWMKSCRALVLGLVVTTVASRVSADLVISDQTAFSQLDGGPRDQDGVAGNGVFALEDNLVITGSGVIYVDVEIAVVKVNGNVRLEIDGRIQPPPRQLREIGAAIEVEAKGDLVMAGNSAIRSFGRFDGGVVHLKSINGAIDLSGNAKVEAHAIGRDGIGGQILLTAGKTITIHDRTNRVMANGTGSGGDVHIQADGATCPAVEINGIVAALGLALDGGVVKVDAVAGEVRLGTQAYRLLAFGVDTPGEISIHAHTFVVPVAPVTLPVANVTQDQTRCP